MEKNRNLVWMFWICIPTFPSTIYWRNCSFSDAFWYLCQESVACRYMGLFLWSLFCTTGLSLFLYNTMLFWLLWLCGMSSNPVLWCLQVCSFFFNTALDNQCFLCFHMDCRIVSASSINNDIGILIGIEMDL
jgi:hypothetical protein